MNRFHRSDVLVDNEDRGKRKGRRRRRNNGVDHRAIPTHHNSCSTVISAEPLGFPLFFHPPPPSHRRSKSPGFIIAFLSSFSSNFLKDFSFQLLSILYQYRYTRRPFRLKCILDASQFGKRERTLGFDENFPRRLPFEIASECTKFPPWHRSNYKIRATVQISPSQSDSHHPLPLPPPPRNWNVAYVLSIATALFLPILRWATLPQRREALILRERKGKGEMVGSRISARVNVEPFSGLSAAVHPPRDPCPRAAVMSTLIITAKVPSPNCSGDRIPRVKRKETKPRSSKTLSLFLSRRCLHSFLLEEKNLEPYFDREFLSSGCIPTIATESRGTIFRFSRTLSIDRRTDRFVRNKRITRRGKWSWREKGRNGF